MKILVFASDNRPLCPDLSETKYNSLSAYINEAYCKRHGYDFIYFQPHYKDVASTSISPSSHNGLRHASWAKLLSAIQSIQWNLYDYVVYIDSDCVFNHVHKPLMHYIERFKDKDLIFFSNAPWHPSFPCAGFFIARSCPAISEFLAFWYDFRIPDNLSPEWKQTVDQAHKDNAYTWNVGKHWEQDALWIMLTQNYKNTKERIAIVPNESQFDGKIENFLHHVPSCYASNRHPTFLEMVLRLQQLTQRTFSDVINRIKIIPLDTSSAFDKLTQSSFSEKNLIYYVIGGQPEYSKILEMSLRSLNRTNDRTHLHIGILCDKHYANHIRKFRHLYDEIYFTEDNPDALTASRRKLKICSLVPNLSEYSKVLYLDCDVLVLNSLRETIFKHMDDVKKDVLYVHTEKVPIDSGFNQNRYFGIGSYTPEMIARFQAQSIQPLNAGQFAFFPNPMMINNFLTLANWVDQIHERYPTVWEQAYLNAFFLPVSLTYEKAFAPYTEILNAAVTSAVSEKELTLLHLANHTVHFGQKLKQMQFFYFRNMTRYKCRYIDSRQQLHTVLKSPHPDGRWKHIAEIGVFRAEFSEYLFEHFAPAHLTLVDPFVETERIMSGNQDGNNVVSFTGRELYESFMEKWRSRIELCRVSFIRDFSRALISLKDDSLDMMYIDGDHAYEGAKQDLAIARAKVRHGGWICGHDYSMNMAKAKTQNAFGVRQAVDEFCKEHGLYISWICMDGCTSFCILNDKPHGELRAKIL